MSAHNAEYGRTDPNTCDHETVILVPSDEGLGFAEDGWLCAVCSTPFAPVQRPKLHFDYCTALTSGCCSCDPNEKGDAPLPDDLAAGFMVPEHFDGSGDG